MGERAKAPFISTPSGFFTNLPDLWVLLTEHRYSPGVVVPARDHELARAWVERVQLGLVLPQVNSDEIVVFRGVFSLEADARAEADRAREDWPYWLAAWKRSAGKKALRV